MVPSSGAATGSGPATGRAASTAAVSATGQPAIPSYAAPTAAQQLPEYANGEAEQIKAAFATGNYRLLSHLPSSLRAHHLSSATASRIDDNLTSAYFVAPHGAYRKFGAKDTLFSTFDYAPEEYSLAADLKAKERKDKEEARIKVNPLPFLYSTPRPVLSNSLAGAPSYADNARYAGLDAYDSALDASRRSAYLDSTRVLNGPFLPAQSDRSIGEDKIIRLRLPEMIQNLMNELDSDWGETSFQIYADKEEIIIIQFQQETIDNQKGLLAYMNMFLSELWHHSGPDGCLYYGLRPPWVRRRIEESLYTMHPEMRQGGKFIQQTDKNAITHAERLAIKQEEENNATGSNEKI